MPDSLFHLDSKTAEGDAFALYRDLYSLGADVEPMGDDFVAQIQGWRMDRMLLFDRHLAQVSHNRSTERVRSDEMEHFTVQVIVSGALEFDVGKGFKTAMPGEIVLFDVGRPMRNRIEKVHVITASVSRNIVEAALGATAALHGRIIPADQGLLFADFMRSVAQRAPHLSANDLPAVSRAFVDLLAVAVGDADLGRAGDLNRVEFSRREAVRRHIEANLTDPELSAVTISAATGISRATLYRIFAADEGVARIIMQRRLLCLRAHLDNLSDQRTLGQFSNACGFRNESHMSRQFREIYHQSPGEYRALVREAQSPAQETALAKERWSAWMTELR